MFSEGLNLNSPAHGLVSIQFNPNLSMAGDLIRIVFLVSSSELLEYLAFTVKARDLWRGMDLFLKLYRVYIQAITNHYVFCR